MASAQPIPFLQPDENNEFYVTEEASKILSKIKNRVAVIAVAGPYRTGKSYLLNRLIENFNPETKTAKRESPNANNRPPSDDSGFSVGNTVNACTKGIWLWGAPYYNPDNDTTYLFLDTEGLNSTGEEVTFDTQIFSLSVLLSSVFILNTQSAITETELEQLELVAECSKRISFSNTDNTKTTTNNDNDDDDDDDENQNTQVDHDLAVHFPRLIWVLRDFALKITDKAGNAISPNEYLESNLRDIIPASGSSTSKKRMVMNKNRIRQCIRNCFITRDCYPLIRPVSEESELGQLSKMSFNQLRPKFQEQIKLLKTQLLNLSSHFTNEKYQEKYSVVKRIQGKDVTGDVLLGLAQVYCDAINTGSVPTILSSWQAVLQQKIQEEIGQYTKSIDEMLWALTEDKNGPCDATTIHTLYSSRIASIQHDINKKFPSDQQSIDNVMNHIMEHSNKTIKKVTEIIDMIANEHNNTLKSTLYEKGICQLKSTPKHSITYSNAVKTLLTDTPTDITTLLDILNELFTVYDNRLKGTDNIKALHKYDFIKGITYLVIQLYSHETGELQNQLGQLTDEINKIQNEYDKTYTKLEETLVALGTSKEKYNTLSDEYKDAKHSHREIVSDLNNTINTYKMNIDKLTHEKSIIETQCQKYLDKRKETSEKLSKLKDDYMELQNSKNTLNTQFEREQNELQQEIKTLQHHIKIIENEKTVLQTRIEHVERESLAGVDKTTALASRLATVTQNEKSLQNDVNKMTLEIEQLENELTELRSKHTIANKETQNTQKEYNLIQKELHATKKELNQIQNEYNTLQDEFNDIKRQHTAISHNKDNDKAEMNKIQRKITQLQDEKDILITENDKLKNEKDILYNQYQDYKQQSQTELHQINIQLQQALNDVHTSNIKRKSRDNNLSIDNDNEQYQTQRKRSLSNHRQQQHSHDHDDDDGYDGYDENNTNDDIYTNDNDDDNNDESYDNFSEFTSGRANKKNNNSGWTDGFTMGSPVKAPDQAQMIKKRRAQGSTIGLQSRIRDNDGDTDNIMTSNGKIRKSILERETTKNSKRGHGNTISDAFKKAAKDSWRGNEEEEYERLVAQGSVIVPDDAEDVREPTSLTISQLKSWLTSIDVELNPAKKYKKQDYIDLLYKHDPRLG